MTWTTNPTFVNGDPLPEADLNTLADNIDHLGSMTLHGTALSSLAASSELNAFVGVRVSNSSNQTLNNTNFTWDPNDFISDAGFHSTVSNTDRLTVPSGLAGKYLVTAIYQDTGLSSVRANLEHYNSSNVLQSSIRLPETAGNGTGQADEVGAGSFVFDLAAGDYIVLHYPLGSRTFTSTNTFLAMSLIGV